MQNIFNNKKTSTHVTNRMTDRLADLLRKKGIHRDEFKHFLNNPEKVNQFINHQILTYKRWEELVKESAEQAGVEAVFIPKISINYSRPLTEAVSAAAPGMHLDPYTYADYGTGYNLNLEFAYTEAKECTFAGKMHFDEGQITESVVLLRSKNPEFLNDTRFWANNNLLRETTPYVAFAISEQYPQINVELLKEEKVRLVSGYVILYNKRYYFGIQFDKLPNLTRKAEAKEGYEFEKMWFAYRR